MKTIVTFSFAVCVAVSLVHATPFNLKRSVGPLDGKCHGIGSADSKNIKSSEKDNHPQWLNTYLNDPEIICGYLLADQSHTDPFQLQGYYSAGPEGHYVPALYELRYYPDATAPVAGQPNIPVEDGSEWPIAARTVPKCSLPIFICPSEPANATPQPSSSRSMTKPTTFPPSPLLTAQSNAS